MARTGGRDGTGEIEGSTRGPRGTKNGVRYEDEEASSAGCAGVKESESCLAFHLHDLITKLISSSFPVPFSKSMPSLISRT